jgi:hypothetical protein
MRASIRALTPIAPPTGEGMRESTLFEAVTSQIDDRGLFQRKVNGEELDKFFGRDGGFVDENLIEGKAKPYTDSETVRAEEREGILQTNLDIAIAEEAHTRFAVDNTKADKIIMSRPLSSAMHGEALNIVKLWITENPLPPAVTGRLNLTDNSFFEATNLPEFSYTTGGGVKTVLWDGAWRKSEIDTGYAQVADSENIEGSVWLCARFGGVDANLSDVRATAVDGIKKAGNALQGVATLNNELQIEKADRANADAAEAEAREAADAAEPEAREAADAAEAEAREAAVSAEAEAREAAIAAEAEAREAGDAAETEAIEAAVSAEAEAREAGDAALNTRIDEEALFSAGAYLHLASENTQILDSNVSLAEGKQLLFNDGEKDEALIGYHSYDGWQAVEVGAEEKGLTLNTFNRKDGLINEHVLVNWKDDEGSVGEGILAYTSDIPNIPAMPLEDGEYKLVISGGMPSWELIE